MVMKEIVKVTSVELDSVMALVGDAIHDMISNGIHQWDEAYPTRNIFEEDITAEELYCVKLDQTIVGVVALNNNQPFEYSRIRWSENDKPLIIHRLCIKPGFQRKGLAKLLMLFAENYAVEQHYSSIRLDAFTCNPKALGLYDSLNYIRKGIVEFRKRDFYCYEKVLIETVSTRL